MSRVGGGTRVKKLINKKIRRASSSRSNALSSNDGTRGKVVEQVHISSKNGPGWYTHRPSFYRRVWSTAEFFGQKIVATFFSRDYPRFFGNAHVARFS
jgi:hypothetical protein